MGCKSCKAISQATALPEKIKGLETTRLVITTGITLGLKTQAELERWDANFEKLMADIKQFSKSCQDGVISGDAYFTKLDNISRRLDALLHAC